MSATEEEIAKLWDLDNAALIDQLMAESMPDAVTSAHWMFAPGDSRARIYARVYADTMVRIKLLKYNVERLD